MKPFLEFLNASSYNNIYSLRICPPTSLWRAPKITQNMFCSFQDPKEFWFLIRMFQDKLEPPHSIEDHMEPLPTGTLYSESAKILQYLWDLYEWLNLVGIFLLQYPRVLLAWNIQEFLAGFVQAPHKLWLYNNSIYYMQKESYLRYIHMRNEGMNVFSFCKIRDKVCSL